MSITTDSAPSRVLGAFSAELRKARSFPAIPSTMLFGVLGLLAAAVFTITQAGQFIAQGREDELGGLTTADVLMLLLHYGQIIPILLGAWTIGQDIPVGPRHSAFLATARRGTLIVIKLVSAALVALIAGVVCTIAAVGPLAVAGGDSTSDTISLAPFVWLIGYWVVLAVVTTALVAATRSLTFTVVPILVWTIGLSDLLSVQVPALTGALDQVLKSAYLQGGIAPSPAALTSTAVQLVVALSLSTVPYMRRDVG
ncbi:MAG: hypothetical protein QM628_02400 [Propionicimonas sp.]